MLDRTITFLSSRRLRLFALTLILLLAASLHPRPASAINCTFQLCPVSNPCPESIILNTFCCAPGKQVACFYAVDATRGCIKNVFGLCG